MPTPAQLEARAATRSLAYARLAVRRPRLVILLGILVPVIGGAILYAIGALTLANPSQNDYLIPASGRVQDALALIAAKDDVNAADQDAAVPRALKRDTRTLFLMFRAALDGANALTPATIAKLKRLEDQLRALPDYPKHCFFDQAALDPCTAQVPTCAPVQTLTSLFYDPCTEANTSTVLSDQDFQAALTSKALTNNGTAFRPDIALLLGSDADPVAMSSQFVRSIFSFGAPVDGFENSAERKSEQRMLYNDFADVFTNTARDQTDDDVEVQVFGLSYANFIFGDIALRDFVWALASMLFVFVFICLHTQSIYLGFMGILQIVLAFPFTWFFYRVVFQVRYFASLHILSVFLILGIGADDIFVFTDAWHQAGTVLGDDCPLTVRMSWAYRRASKAMLVTSFTTSMAFFVTAASPIMPISTFGIWAACLIIFQYVLCITLYPANIVMWHRFWRQRSLWVRCGLCVPPVIAPNEPEPLEAEQESGAHDSEEPDTEAAPREDIPRAPHAEQAVSSNSDADTETKPTEDDALEYRRLERFFRNLWVRWIHRVRFVVLILGATLFGLAIWRAILLRPLSEDEEWIPEHVDIRRAALWLSDDFPVSEDSNQLSVSFVYGVAGLDRSSADYYDPSEIGSPQYDAAFSLRTVASQEFLLQTCNETVSEQNLGIADTSNPASCFIKDFYEFQNSSFREYASESELVASLKNFFNFADQNGALPYRRYKDLTQIGIRDDQLLFVELTFKTTTTTNLPFSKMNPIYLTWQAYVDGLNDRAPKGVDMSYATAGYPWSWGVTQNTLVRSSVGGIRIAMGVAFAALVVSTLNVIVSLLATACIAGIVACVLGTIQLLGWELGITESIAAVIIVGFSVDYVVHIGNSYVESKREGRFNRTQDALTDMGISVVAGAISTVGSGVFLWGAVLIFFHKFATILVVTISFSLLWSLCIFTASLLVLGPDRNAGSLRPFFDSLVHRLSQCFRKTSAEEPVEESVAS